MKQILLLRGGSRRRLSAARALCRGSRPLRLIKKQRPAAGAGRADTAERAAVPFKLYSSKST